MMIIIAIHYHYHLVNQTKYKPLFQNARIMQTFKLNLLYSVFLLIIIPDKSPYVKNSTQQHLIFMVIYVILLLDFQNKYPMLHSQVTPYLNGA